jgi:hypothetical protein
MAELLRFGDQAIDWSRVYAVVNRGDTTEVFADTSPALLSFAPTLKVDPQEAVNVWKKIQGDKRLIIVGNEKAIAVDRSLICAITREESGDGARIIFIRDGVRVAVHIAASSARALMFELFPNVRGA